MPPSTETKIDRGMWLALTAALLGWMFDGFEMGIFPLVARPALIEVLGLTDDAKLAAHHADPSVQQQARDRVDARVGPWNGRIVAAFLVGAALGGWGFGWLGDRIGRVRAMVFSVLMYSLFTGLCGLAQEAWHLAGLRFLAALGMGGEWALGVALVMESWPARHRPVLAGLIGAASNVGFLLTTYVAFAWELLGGSISEGGWRWLLGLCAFPALLTFFLRLFVPESDKWRQAVTTGPRPKLADIFTRDLWRKSLMGAILGGVALVGTWGTVQWIPLWVNKETHDQAMTNTAARCLAVGAIVGSFLGAVIGHRWGRRWTYFALCLGSLAACSFLFRRYMDVQPKLDAVFFTIVVVTGALTASFYGWLPLYLPELFPTRVRATGQGFSFNFGRIIAAGGALSMGYLMSDQVFHGSYARAGATISLIYLLGLIAIWVAPETQGRTLPE